MMDTLAGVKVLFEDDGWLLLKGTQSELDYSWYGEDPYNSGIYHKCINHPEIKRVSSCNKDWETELWRCTNCDILVPMEVVGVWTLHNFDVLGNQE